MQSLDQCLWAQKDLNSVPVTVNVMEWDKEELSGCAAENINLSSSASVCEVRAMLLWWDTKLVELSGLVCI